MIDHVSVTIATPEAPTTMKNPLRGLIGRTHQDLARDQIHQVSEAIDKLDALREHHLEMAGIYSEGLGSLKAKFDPKPLAQVEADEKPSRRRATA